MQKRSLKEMKQELLDEVRDWERALILERLKEAKGSITKAAKGLGVDRANLQRLMRKYHINRPHLKSLERSKPI